MLTNLIEFQLLMLTVAWGEPIGNNRGNIDGFRILRARGIANHPYSSLPEVIPLSSLDGSIGFRAELLFDVFGQRCERGSTVVTSNLPFDEWTGVFGSERLTGALLDRLIHHVHIPEMNGDSYRLAHSKRRKRSGPSDGTPQD